ncbi:hypothetical protein [Methylocucumis oryzae]|uniref:DUF4435 domain-containing protein n=1 Tax=Methylocucumis oryzae TaxID=1632867 RepID=A0A0F3IKV2_9GAMM|nr:hypothetical protein [Methylocucumis oryzae]KJV07307.1 hypothetical protein VZ94_05585 [Methylocucumis oryzae]
MQRYLNESDVIGSITLQLHHPNTKHKLWVLVEGETDQKLYGNLITGKNTVIERVHGGVTALRKAMAALIIKSPRIIGIRDADFLHLNGQQEIIDRLFLTDAHDAEMMMVACDKAWQQVVAEYLPEKRTDFAQLRSDLLLSLRFLGGLRWLNDSQQLELNFKAGITNFYDAENLAIPNQMKCIEIIASCSPNKTDIPTERDISEKIMAITDDYNLCQGHDFECAFSLHVKAKTNKGISDTDVGKALRLAYRLEDFVTTSLYQQLKNWESETRNMLF